MAGVNKVIIVGRLGQDPEMKAVGQGTTITRFSVATSENWMGKDGQKQERTEWHRVIAWGKLAELCGKYLAKGRQVYLEGRLQTTSWEDNGQKKYATEIVANTVQFLGGAAGTASASDNSSPLAPSGASFGGGPAGGSSAMGMNQSSSGSSGGGAASGGRNDFNFSDFGPEPSFNQDENLPF